LLIIKFSRSSWFISSYDCYTLRPHSRVTGNFVANSRSPKFPKTISFAKSLKSWASGTRERATLTRDSYGLQNTKSYRKSRVTTVPIVTATQPRNWQRGSSTRGREIRGERLLIINASS